MFLSWFSDSEIIYFLIYISYYRCISSYLSLSVSKINVWVSIIFRGFVLSLPEQKFHCIIRKNSIC